MCAHGGDAGLGGVMEMVEHAGKAREGQRAWLFAEDADPGRVLVRSPSLLGGSFQETQWGKFRATTYTLLRYE